MTWGRAFHNLTAKAVEEPPYRLVKGGGVFKRRDSPRVTSDKALTEIRREGRRDGTKKYFKKYLV